MKSIQVSADVQSGLRPRLLLLMQGYLMVELAEKKVRIVENASGVLGGPIKDAFLAIFLLNQLFLLSSYFCKIVVEVVSIELFLS